MPVLIEWQPPETFNLLDYRDLQNFPQYDPAPYVLKFNFLKIEDPLVINAIVTDIRGWNIPECQTQQLLSRVTISKNGFEDVYYNKTPTSSILDLDRTLVLASTKDVIYIVLYPLCPVHMMDVNQIVFLTPTVKDTPTTDHVVNKNTKPVLPPLPTKDNDDKYWYLYATLLIMILFIFITFLFSLMKKSQKKKE